MNQSYPVPPPELVKEWAHNRGYSCADELWEHLATQAAQWGADQELEACLEHLFRRGFSDADILCLRSNRRPKPPSLKESALNALEHILRNSQTDHGANTIRRALEQLPDAL